MQKTTPHFWNLNEDSQLSGKVLHFIKPGKYLLSLPSSMIFATAKGKLRQISRGCRFENSLKSIACFKDDISSLRKYCDIRHKLEIF